MTRMTYVYFCIPLSKVLQRTKQLVLNSLRACMRLLKLGTQLQNLSYLHESGKPYLFEICRLYMSGLVLSEIQTS